MRWTLGLDSDAFNVFASWVYGGKIEFDLGKKCRPAMDLTR